MCDYTGMSAYYDLIMTSGYYDYDMIVDRLAGVEGAHDVLEIGAGTGLVLERLAKRCPDRSFTGIDLTPAMLSIGAERLAGFPHVTTHLQNVITLDLDGTFDLAFSYGGVWYFVPDGDRFSMISHIRDGQANADGLERVAAHLKPSGRLLLGVQAPHHDYSRPVTDGMEYAQRITPLAEGFSKYYSLTDRGGQLLMEQTTEYRVYPFDEATELLDKCGFEYHAPSGDGSPLFLEFGKR
jgi:SAM-dependent methyltransferase